MGQKLSQLDLLMVGSRGLTDRLSSLERGAREAITASGPEITEPPTIRPNVLINSSFEYFDRGSNAPQGWTISGAATIQAATPKDGNALLRLAGGATAAQQPFGSANQPAGSFALSGYVRASSANQRVILSLNMPGPSIASGTFVFLNDLEDTSAQTDIAQPDNVWRRFYRSFLWAGAAPFTVTIQHSGSGFVELDALKLERDELAVGFMRPTPYLAADSSSAVHIRNLSADNLIAGTLNVGGATSGNPRISVKDDHNTEIVVIGDPTNGYYGIEVKGEAGMRVSGSGSIEVSGGGSVEVTGGGDVRVTNGGHILVDGTGAIVAQGASGQARTELNILGLIGYDAAGNARVKLDSNSGALRVLGPGGISLEGGGSLVVGNPTGAHLEYDGTGLHAYNAANLKTVDISAADGIARIDADAFIVDGTVQFDSLDVTGEVHIGQTLRVGANVLLVDAATGNIGVNQAPDPQFDLDVRGNFRAGGYIVGRHALQLANARMIVHFDGPNAPGDTTGVATGHKGQVATATGGVIYQPGKFGKSVQVAEAARNLVRNPSFEAGVSLWSNDGGPSYAVLVEGGGVDGRTALRLYKIAEGAAYLYTICNAGILGGRTFTLSFAARAHTDGYATLVAPITLIEYGGVGQTVASIDCGPDLTTEWQTFSVTGTVLADSTTTGLAVLLRSTTSENGGGPEIEYDNVQVTETAYVVPYLDGSLGVGHSWEGVAHNSESNRAAASLYYDPDALVPHKGTVAFWCQIPAGTRATTYLLAKTGATSQMAISYDGIAGWSFSTTQSGDATYANAAYATVPGWYHIAATWKQLVSGTELRLYINGELVATRTGAYPLPEDGPLSFGSYAGYSPANTLLDELAVVDRVLTETEIRAIYESDAPVFAASSVFSWRSPNNLAWMDANGMFAVDKDGNAAFAVVGVDDFSWGNLGAQTLDKGDLLIGNGGAGHYILYDASEGTMTFKGDGSGLTGILPDMSDISIDGANIINPQNITAISGGAILTGSIAANAIAANAITADKIAATALDARIITGSTVRTAASGARVVLDATGLRGLDASNTAQVQISTLDGALRAAGGNLLLNNGGIQINGYSSESYFLSADRAVSYQKPDGTRLGHLYAFYGGTRNHLDIRSEPNASDGSDITLTAKGVAAGQTRTAQLILTGRGTAATSSIYGDSATVQLTGATTISNDLTVTGTARKPQGGSWVATSDARVKNVLGDYTRGLEAIRQLHAKKYRYTGAGLPTDETYLGYVAQDVIPAVPEAVGTYRAKIQPEDAEETELFTVTNDAIFYALVNAVQQLADKIDELEAKLAASA